MVISSENCPTGSDNDPNAPWNQSDPEAEEIEVTVSITLSKKVKIYVDDYEKEDYIDEEGNYCKSYDFRDCDLQEAVREQIMLPNSKFAQFSDWVEEDLEVTMED